jgi:hypothetical protein
MGFFFQAAFRHKMRVATDTGLTAVNVPAAKHSQYSFRQPARPQTLGKQGPRV